MLTTRILTATAALALTATAALAAPPVEMGDTKLGQVLTDMKGMTLYTFDKDSGDMSACNGGCAAKWPPLLAEAGATADGDYGLIKRDDGAMQWTYDGKPLYLWINDKAPGDTTGDGVGGVWHAAK